MGHFADRGSVTVEAAIWAPILVIVACVLWAFGRADLAGSAVQNVAIDAAREASMARTASGARTIATTTARRTFAEGDLHCADTTIVVDTSGFSVPVGRPAQVEVDVTCTVALADLALPGLPGTRVLRSRWVSALDTYRGRT